jgi:hypothetical protein
LLLVPLVLAAVLWTWASCAPGAVEAWYGRAFFPALAGFVSAVTRRVPFSLGEPVLALLAAAACVVPWLCWRRARRAGSPALGAAGTAALGAVSFAGTVWLAFLVVWGLNYKRLPTEQLFRLPALPDAAALRPVIAAIGDRLDALRAVLPENERGVAIVTVDTAALDASLGPLQDRVLAEYGLPVVGPSTTKSFALGPLYRYLGGGGGMYVPFTCEPTLLPPAPPILLPYDLAHERAHLAGIAHEDAASFVGLLTTWRSADPGVRYAGWLELWLQLRHGSSERSEGVRRDVEAIHSFYLARKTPVGEYAWKVYGGFLSAHGVAGGTRSYARVASLALAYLHQNGAPPDALR